MKKIDYYLIFIAQFPNTNSHNRFHICILFLNFFLILGHQYNLNLILNHKFQIKIIKHYKLLLQNNLKFFKYTSKILTNYNTPGHEKIKNRNSNRINTKLINTIKITKLNLSKHLCIDHNKTIKSPNRCTMQYLKGELVGNSTSLGIDLEQREV